MAKPSLPTPIPASISPIVALTSTADVGGIWDLGLEGMGFMLSSLDDQSPFEFRSYEIQSIPVQKQRIDDADEPGEQTLFPWWTRAQHSWHEGAGQKVFDSAFSSRYAFLDSKGLDIWEAGRVTLLKDTAELRNDSVNDHHLIAADTALIYTANGVIFKDPDPDATSESGEDNENTHSGVEINSLAYDGESVYAAFSGASLGIKKIVVSTFSAWVDVNDHLDVDIIGFVKGRLIGGKGPGLFDYDLSQTDEPEAFFNDPASTWVWTAITESGPAVYVSGFAGERSEIYAARLTAQDVPFASVATLGAPRSVWQAPEGETIHSIKGYIGQSVLIGTSRGVRVGNIVTGEGDLSVSELIAETEFPVTCFDPQLEFAWFGWTKFDGTSSGLGRVHLGDLNYASDLMFTSQGEIKSVARYNDRMYFVTDEGATSRIIKEHATQLVASGFFTNCCIRFGTTERKTIRYFDILTQGVGKWSLEMGVNASTSYSPYATDNDTGGLNSEILDLEGSRFNVQIILKRNPSDATDGPTLLEWRLRAEPRSTGRFRFFVPVMVYDFVVNGADREVGKVGFAIEMLTHLENLYRSDADLSFVPLSAGVPGGRESLTVKMEELRFKTYTPPDQGRGFGGIALMVLREVR